MLYLERAVAIGNVNAAGDILDLFMSGHISLIPQDLLRKVASVLQVVALTFRDVALSYARLLNHGRPDVPADIALTVEIYEYVVKHESASISIVGCAATCLGLIYAKGAGSPSFKSLVPADRS